MLAIDLISVIIVCICVGIIYTIFGYNVTELFTDGPNWKPWEQCLFWMFWPIIITMFLLACVAVVLATIIIGIPVLFVIAYDYIKVLNK
jgi:hypothetical protein